MAATVDPLPSMPEPVHRSIASGNSKRPKPRDGVDAALLCSRLEAHKREQDAARVRKEKREAVRNGRYVPRSAAKSFAATTSHSMVDVTNLVKERKHRSDTVLLTAEPLSIGGRVCIPSEQLYSALDGSLQKERAVRIGVMGEAIDENDPNLGPSTQSNSINPSMRRSTTSVGRRDGSPAKSIKSRKPNESAKSNAPTLAERRRSRKVAELVLAMEKKLEHAKMPETPIPANFEGWDRTEAEKRHSEPSARKDSIELERRRASVKSEKRSSTKAEPKRDSMNPAANDNNPKPRSNSPGRSRSSDGGARVRAANASPDRGRPQYRPGDAAKRRSCHNPADYRALSLQAFQFQEGRVSKFREKESLEGTIPELEELDPKSRPKMAAQDRPDWCQRSQNAYDMRRTLNILPKMLPDKKEKSSRKGSAVEANGMTPPALGQALPRKLSGAQNDHLIADAVAIIQKQKRNSRREGLFGLFKGL